MGFTAAAELPGSKIGTFASMVPMLEAQLERSLEDITGPIDPQQVHKPPAPCATLQLPWSGPVDFVLLKVAAARQEG